MTYANSSDLNMFATSLFSNTNRFMHLILKLQTKDWSLGSILSNFNHLLFIPFSRPCQFKQSPKMSVEKQFH